MYIGFAKDNKEVSKAINLATKIFRSNENFDEALRSKRIIMFQKVKPDLRNVIVIKNFDEDLIGTCFLIDRLFYRGKFKLQGTFISSVCIDERYRKLGFSKLLIEYAIKEIESRNSQFAIVIARRAVDHFYNKFGFWGISQYNKIKLNFKKCSLKFEKGIFSTAKKKDIPEINEIYKYIYSKLYGSCSRTEKDWKLIFDRAANQNFQIVIYKVDKKISGYMIYSNFEIVEIASTKSVSCFEMVKNFYKKVSMDKLIINCSKIHPIFNDLKHLDVSILSRHCSYGGHMVRITNHSSLLKILKYEYLKKINHLNIKKYHYKNLGSEIKFIDERLEIFLTKLPHTIENTFLLMGLESFSSKNSVSSIFDRGPFNFLLFDQF